MKRGLLIQIMETNNQRLLHTFAALADLGQEIANTADFEEMLRASFHLLLGSVAIRRGAVAEYDRERDTLRLITARGLEQAQPAELTIARDHARQLASLGATLTLHDATSQAEHFMDNHKTSFTSAEVELLLPLVVRERLIGVVLLGEKASGEKFSEEDLETLSVLSRHIAVGVHSHHLLEEVERKAKENQRLYDGLRTIYKETVRAFAAAIDMKDRYTQGHSVRVGKYSEVIAREMGWSDDQVEGITIAGYLHDIGKLIVDLSVINSPERFSAKDSEEMSRHPAAGYEILARINHPYAEIPLMARYHHERMDGKGYPDGLKGDQIPPGAKIVTLADSFDAMTTDRPYRKRLPLENVFADFRENTGTQFDSAVVCAFCRAFLNEIDGSTKAQPITRLLGKNYDNIDKVSPLLASLISDLEGRTETCATSIAH
jgi:HD-GYP domain-containing protein (c-di-GMP phosphodiesterase class II)